jgi:two-component system response regulator AtoC
VALVLLVFAPGGVRQHTLPPRGSVVVGRNEACDIAIDDASVSRRHARITTGGTTIEVEDLGGSNGTRIRRSTTAAETAEVTDVRLAPGENTPLALDEPMMLGSVTVLVREEAADPHDAAIQELPDDIVCVSAATRRTFDIADRLARGPLNVLVTGETGAGKEVVAAYIHRRSTRAEGPFVEVNCAALSESLAESELFGHQKGAFTGALSAKAGYFEAASGGTLFLDEIGELPLALQAKLLRVLETQRVVRVGSTAPIAIDVRIVAATHRHLPTEVERGSFRQDLYFRLNGMTLAVPPLRERLEDIPVLASRFAARAAAKMGIPSPTLDPPAQARLTTHHWPGNVRELRNVVERAVTLAATETIGASDIVLDDPTSESSPPFARDGALRDDLAAEEKRRILEALERAEGNQTRAAESIGMPRRTFVARLKEYGLTKPRR